MGKGERTRKHILREAAGLFSRKGYAGASVSDVMDATGLRKGGIYRHFRSKQELAADALELAVERMRRRFADALQGAGSAPERLRAVIDVFVEIPDSPPVPGGCPVMNAAIEHDDGNPLLRERTRRAMDELRSMVRRVARVGVARGELREGLDPDELASVLIATLEGGIMLSRLYGDPAHVRRAAEHLRRHLDTLIPE